MIDFDNIQGLMDYFRDFMSSHDVENIDFGGYRKIRLDDETEVASDYRLKELMEMDSHGECLGS